MKGAVVHVLPEHPGREEHGACKAFALLLWSPLLYNVPPVDEGFAGDGTTGWGMEERTLRQMTLENRVVLHFLQSLAAQRA